MDPKGDETFVTGRLHGLSGEPGFPSSEPNDSVSIHSLLPFVSLDVSRGLVELRSLYEHLQARILEMIETLDEVRASADYEVFRAAEEDESVIGSFVSAQQEELEKEIEELKVEAERIAGEATELVGEVPF